MKHFLILLLLSVGLIGCTDLKPATNIFAPTPTNAPTHPHDTLQDDYEVYTTILPALFGSSPVFVIEQNTFAKAGDLTLPNGELQALLPETLSDFISQNSQSYPLKMIFSRDDKIFILADRADFYEKPSPENGLSCTWMRAKCFNASKFKAAYPEASGITLLSKIGYSSDRTQALVTAEQDNGQDIGVIYILLLQKESGQWKIEDTYELFWII